MPLVYRKMVNIVLIHQGMANFIRSVEVMANTGDNYYDVLKEEKEKLESKGVIISAIVGDNASGVQNALLRCKFSSYNIRIFLQFLQDTNRRPYLFCNKMRSAHYAVAAG